MEDRKRTPIESILKAICIPIWFVVAHLLVSSYLAIFFGNKAAEVVDKNQYLISIVIYIIAFLGVWIFEKNKKEFLDAFKTTSFKEIGMAILDGAIFYVISQIIVFALSKVFKGYDLSGSFQGDHLILCFIALVIVAPIVEEYLYRFVVQGCLKENFGSFWAILIQGVLFGMGHNHIIQKIYAMVLGIGFGYICEKKGTIRYTILMHITINCIGFVIGIMQVL